MFLQHKPSGGLVEILTLDRLCDPCQDKIAGQLHAGEEMQDPESFDKTELIFPSGEPLPVCWLNPNYRSENVV
ncbi:acetyltransferase [Lusitaniella coriacea LEGE 07157]|uniref:Acetyltransferase n=1 Tax=Lusitaniella coriacea LEGE 07157 TaxID=945747 RepID=A0A8J7DWP4_9CYAN|nr:acetyltransferase [Lusitaniella coriacea]MBE9116208.1 acetyltransferase [Lusitaniella coriacea LEGE 07157]